MVRGVALIVVAVLLGVVLLDATDDEPVDATAAPDDDVTLGTDEEDGDDEGDGAGDGAGAVATTTTTEVPVARPPAEVTVLVANGSGVAGAAGAFTEQIGASGYVTATPTNLTGGGRTDASVVYFTEGFEAEAAALAGTLSPVPVVQALPEPAPVDDLRGAAVLLVVGPDLATG